MGTTDSGDIGGDALSFDGEMELMRALAEKRALEGVGLDKVFSLFEGEIVTEVKRKEKTSTVLVGTERYVLVQDKRGEVRECRIETVVNGVRIKGETVGVGAWVARLLASYQSEVGRQVVSKDTLSKILGLS